jgi:phosphoribosylformylglycinamidine synthase
LAESCISGPDHRGATVEIPASGTRTDVPLFNESQSRIILTADPKKADAILALLAERGVPGSRLGTVTDGETLEIATAGKSFSWPLAGLHSSWSAAIPSLMEA